eukprot:CAMPEP_0115828376 /NCGR_PEP_ID=MMETSP0287-20121206/540_1 /TAXON_ID=412157 /ORGANISM="Chrysochromulina rotalis, Strain UIO044" /LENGTH=64 /DNA_ID=CAMNT_0003281587 /DNA_START=929 /DNA_END=1123 /DNA_ORIENTATION=-
MRRIIEVRGVAATACACAGVAAAAKGSTSPSGLMRLLEARRSRIFTVGRHTWSARRQGEPIPLL